MDAGWRFLMWIFARSFDAYCFLCRPNVRGVYVAVWCSEKILLVENSYRAGFSFPSGGIKRGEDSLKAARRELAEEVGLDIGAEAIVPAFDAVIHHRNMRDKVAAFEVILDYPPRLVLDRREVVAARFVSVQDARRLNLSKVVREYLRRHSGGDAVAALE
jgi:8-oxo-dGTP pyrophosphatase MutT (NUDIX family)